MRLKDKTVLVTGASSGIGQAIAIACAKEGAFVIVHYRKNETGAEETLSKIKDASDGFVAQADLTVSDEIAAMMLSIKDQGLSIDMLVNNAGEAIPGAIDDDAHWLNQWNTIFMSVVRMTNAVLADHPSLSKTVNIGSIYGQGGTADPSFSHYSAAKAALHNYTYSLAKKLAPKVLVNCVAPGYTWTPAWEGTPQEDQDLLMGQTKIKRYIQPEEIASMVVELLDNEAITGEVIRIDGGLHLQDV